MLANPIYLWSLLGLAIPIAIHLLSRKDGKVIKIGSLRHVTETSTQQFKSLKLNEVVLLLLRCLLILILSLILCNPSINLEKNTKWLLLEKGVEKNKQIKSLLDSLEKNGYEKHSLTSGFPLWKENSISSNLSYGALINQLKEKNVGEIIIIYNQNIKKFLGNRLALPAHIHTISVEPEEKEFILRASPLHDSVYIWIGRSSSATTSYSVHKTKQAPDSITPSTLPAIKIKLIADASSQYEKKIILASLHAAEELTFRTIQISETDPAHYNKADSAQWIFWISQQVSPEVGTNTITLQPKSANQLIEQTAYNRWLITGKLNEDVAIKLILTTTLAALLTTNDTLNNIEQNNDQRMLADQLAWSFSDVAEKNHSSSVFPISPYLFILFILVLLLERYLSFKRGQ